MRDFIRRFLPQSVRGQFAAVIIIAVVVILSVGSVVENFTASIDLPAVDDSATRTAVVAALLREAPTEARSVILAGAERAGFDFKILPRKQIDDIPVSYLQWRNIEWLFRFDNEPTDGRWLTIDGEYAFVLDLDQQAVLAHFGMPDTLLTSGFIRSLSYKFMAFIALPSLIWLFAVWAVTGPAETHLGGCKFGRDREQRRAFHRTRLHRDGRPGARAEQDENAYPDDDRKPHAHVAQCQP